MPAKKAVFNFKLETELRDEFMAAAEKSHRPAAQIVRELMRADKTKKRHMRNLSAGKFRLRVSLPVRAG